VSTRLVWEREVWGRVFDPSRRVDAVKESANEVSHNVLVIKGCGRKGIVLEKADGTRVTGNVIQHALSDPQ
jgi:hypothetical protein